MEKILVSACLLGQKVRYDGSGKALADPIWQQWLQQERLVAICPECAGGLATPRAAAERQYDGRILTCDGEEVTEAFERGAEEALRLAQQQSIHLAILKANSPSCGNEQIYDGSFQGHKIQGQGMAAQRLRESGVRVFNEFQIEQAKAYLQLLEGRLRR